MLRNREDAEEAAQEALLRAWRKLHTFRPGSNVRAWFLTIVANQCRQARRRRWWAVIRLGEPPARPSASAEDQVVRDWDLRRALGELSAEQRLVLTLRYFLDLPFEEVAAVLEVKPAAARARASRAVARLRADLGEVNDDG